VVLAARISDAACRRAVICLSVTHIDAAVTVYSDAVGGYQAMP
jgi:hypothetical protein